jgi:hypothetical protein
MDRKHGNIKEKKFERNLDCRYLMQSKIRNEMHPCHLPWRSLTVARVASRKGVTVGGHAFDPEFEHSTLSVQE